MFGFNAERHERRHPWVSLLVRMAICALPTALLVFALGAIGLALVLPLWAFVFSGDLLNLVSAAWRGARRLALRDLEGCYYAYKGTQVRVLEDTPGMRWIFLADLARVLGEQPPEVGLRAHFPAGLREMPDGLYLSDEATLAYLATRHSDRAARLRVWVERAVWQPARQRGR